jgi:hypothetical protein
VSLIANQKAKRIDMTQSKLDLSKSADLILTIQKENEAEVAAIYRQATTTRAQRIYAAGYQQAERDYAVGPFSVFKASESKQ